MCETGASSFLYYFDAVTFRAVLQSYKKSTSLMSMWTDGGRQTYVSPPPFLHGRETHKLKETQNDVIAFVLILSLFVVTIISILVVCPSFCSHLIDREEILRLTLNIRSIMHLELMLQLCQTHFAVLMELKIFDVDVHTCPTAASICD